ncbi:hypothetical protein [Clostridium frigidicarnis]|uniref:Uncharacterized protein n=1 Tax=Clostridium frigidicarnis TaxID=84698 RepID=A0A1I0V202_9CLOT|nr:hypothetical protein [Clostridium frigidicarnis]SFA70110.1 hypothetical protein SAMN04488528_100187 [Clostridium frigidicarnis]
MAWLISRGHSLDSLLNATATEKIFYERSYEMFIEFEESKLKAMAGDSSEKDNPTMGEMFGGK